MLLLRRFPAPMLGSRVRASYFSRPPSRAFSSPPPGSAALGAAPPGGAALPHRAVGWWLAGTAGLVYAMVVLGGVTRLTRSGLSIVEWKLAGEPLPRSAAEWEAAFDKYRAFPEFQRVNSRMSLEEFKPIYVMEWAHRMWGRGLGLVFGAPLLALAVARRVPPGLGPRLGAMLALGGGQGLVGWWMVKSGLEHDRFKPHEVPRVSPYRLATHLTGAWLLYSLLVWSALDVLRGAPGALAPGAAAATRALRPWALGAAGVVGVTTLSGAFVAGNDAGRAFNDWPLFAGRWVPEGLWDPALGARNLFENTATVQFDHRALAYSSLAGVGALHAAVARAGGRAALPPPVWRGAVLVAGAVAAQATLGVATLVTYVPVALGAAHQAGALGVWTAVLYLLHALKKAAPAPLPAAAAAAPPAARAAMALALVAAAPCGAAAPDS
jgi:cytochrome c oxidase assembly protein subunit 15